MDILYFLGKWTLRIVVLLFVLISLVLFLRYGRGEPYEYNPGVPLYGENDLEVFFSYDEPIGNVAVTAADSAPRVFFTIHPESRPKDYKLCEIVNGIAQPYPNSKQDIFITPLGVYIDSFDRLWVIDHGNHAMDGARLLAFDLNSNQLVIEYTFPSYIAEKGSFFNDLSVSPDGKFVVIADASFIAKKPSLVIFDVERRDARSLLDGHPSIRRMKYVPVTPEKKMRFLLGTVDLLVGIDGIDIDPDGEYIYYAAMTHDGLYRIPLKPCTDFNKPMNELEDLVELVSKKPLSDGIRVDEMGVVYITDIEHQGVAIVDLETSELKTLIKDERIRWADGFSVGRDGYVYLADSDIPNQMLRSRRNIRWNKPYNIFRFKWYKEMPKITLPDTLFKDTLYHNLADSLLEILTPGDSLIPE